MTAKAQSVKQNHIVLLGASVGKAWNLPELSSRLKDSRYSFEYVGLYQFDKTTALDKLIERNDDKPDAIILKECAAYFPGDITFEESKKLIEKWVDSCKKYNVIPILATVCPITELRDERFKTTNPIKRYIKSLLNISMMTCMDRIKEFNDWLKDYAIQNNLAVLDLEAPLLISEEDRYLNDIYAKPDGLHLNTNAYEALDQIVLPTLDSIDFSNQR